MERNVIGCVLILLGIAAGMYAGIASSVLCTGDAVLAGVLAVLLAGAGIGLLGTKRK